MRSYLLCPSSSVSGTAQLHKNPSAALMSAFTGLLQRILHQLDSNRIRRLRLDTPSSSTISKKNGSIHAPYRNCTTEHGPTEHLLLPLRFDRAQPATAAHWLEWSHGHAHRSIIILAASRCDNVRPEPSGLPARHRRRDSESLVRELSWTPCSHLPVRFLCWIL